MLNGVRNVRSIRINVSTVNNNSQSQRSQVRRRATPPAQPRPVSRNRNLQVPRVPNILSNLSPFRRTKSTKSTRKKIKGYKDTQSQGKKRKTKVNVANKYKRASQKKRGRKMSRRQGGGKQTCWKPDTGYTIKPHAWITEFGSIFESFMNDHTPTPTYVGGNNWEEKVTIENFSNNEEPAKKYLKWFADKMIEKFKENSKTANRYKVSLKTDEQIVTLSEQTPDKQFLDKSGNKVPQGINKYKINGLELKNLLMEYFRNKFLDPSYWTDNKDTGPKVNILYFAKNILKNSKTFPQFFNCSK